MVEWKQADVFQLIEMYKERRALWDPSEEDYKHRNKRHNAWIELDHAFELQAGEAEKKIRKLVGQFQRELRKSTESGKGAEVRWIYFKQLLFLKDKCQPRTLQHGLRMLRSSEPMDDESLDAQDTEQVSRDNDCLVENSYDLVENSYKAVQNDSSAPGSSVGKLNFRSKKKKINAIADEAYKVMKEYSCKKKDEFDIFGEYVAITLRKLNKLSSPYAKFEINKILFQAEVGQYELQSTTPTPHS